MLEELDVSLRMIPAYFAYEDIVIGNERLQEMMGIMAKERGGQVFATDER